MSELVKATKATHPTTQSASSDTFQTGRALIISFGHTVHDTCATFLTPLLPAFIANLSLSNTQAGLLTLFQQGPSLLQPLIGHLADRVSLRYLVILAPAVTAAMMSLLGVAPTYAALALLLIVAGISSASMHAVGPAMVGSLSGQRLGRGMSFWMVGGSLGRALGPIVIVSAVRALTLEGTPWLMIIGLLGSIILYTQLKNVRGRLPSAEERASWGPALRSMRPLLLPLAGIIVTRSFVLAALITYLPIFLSEEGADLWLAGASLTLVEGAGVIGTMLGGAISDRVSRRMVLSASMLTTPLLMFVFLAAKGWLQFPLLLVSGFAAMSPSAAMMALVQESFPDNRALVNGIYLSLSFVLYSGVVVVIGAMGDGLGLRLAFTLCAVISLLGLPLVLLLPRGKPQRG